MKFFSFQIKGINLGFAIGLWIAQETILFILAIGKLFEQKIRIALMEFLKLNLYT